MSARKSPAGPHFEPTPPGPMAWDEGLRFRETDQAQGRREAPGLVGSGNLGVWNPFAGLVSCTGSLPFPRLSTMS